MCHNYLLCIFVLTFDAFKSTKSNNNELKLKDLVFLSIIISFNIQILMLETVLSYFNLEFTLFNNILLILKYINFEMTSLIQKKYINFKVATFCVLNE